jgi:capsule polysaccharide export protein KpsE/RkpR
MSESGGDLNKAIKKLELTITNLENRILALEKQLKYEKQNVSANNLNENTSEIGLDQST